MYGFEIVVNCLKEQNVETVFGYPGASVLSLYDCLAASGIRHILSVHEQFCCHAADGYARASGKPGVVIATSGPGATNLVTGIANAYMDSIPIVIITGNVPLNLLGHDSFQEIDITGVTMPVTKHNYIVKSVEELAETVRNAFKIANSGRKGPVLVDIPTDIFENKTDYNYYNPEPEKDHDYSLDEIANAAEIINKASKPFICSGGGMVSSGASKILGELAGVLKCPVATTVMGLGTYYGEHLAGLMGMQIGETASDALKGCDLFIALGVRFSERLVRNILMNSPDAKILHIDIDQAEIGKNAEVYSKITGDLFYVLPELIKKLVKREAAWFKEVYKKPVNAVYDIINKYMDGFIFTTEVGLHQIEAVNNLQIKAPRHFITSGGLGTMGFGLPAAIGAAVATGKMVVNIAGDGSFNMNIGELSTAVKYNLPLIQIIFNNHSLKMIEKWQQERYGGRIYQSKTPVMDYIRIAEGMGARAFKAETPGEFEAAVIKAVEAGPPSVIDLEVL